ncbi:MAG: putative membrane protein YphA (DoxX/SURF4 family) [Alphaproteobacteria bacterium]|jgi:uncharacterized membrane protein YphA (DoxX/SURF4 family)
MKGLMRSLVKPTTKEAAGGYEYPLLWGLVALALVIRGGGELSVDRQIGWRF